LYSRKDAKTLRNAKTKDSMKRNPGKNKVVNAAFIPVTEKLKIFL